MRGYSAQGVFVPPDASEGRLGQPIFLSLQVGAAQVLPETPRDVHKVIVSVKQGTLDLWIGDRGIEFVAPIPQFHFLSGQGVQWFPLPPARYIFTVASTGPAKLLACITFVG